jgi:18S rRNA (guanine1575-N7)-methyltransferase
MWVGLDISRAMLDVAMKREVEGDVIHSDMGHGFGFRPGTFDGAVSISALQWLCSAEVFYIGKLYKPFIDEIIKPIQET